MANETTTVETNAGEAAAPEVDLLDEFQAVLKQNEKLTVERDNYKKIGLARKRGETLSDDKDDEIEQLAERRAQELLIQKEQAANEAKSREIALKALKENRELKIALKNRQGIVTTPTSAASSDPEKSKDNYWSPEQLAYFKKRNLDPEKVKQNHLKLKS